MMRGMLGAAAAVTVAAGLLLTPIAASAAVDADDPSPSPTVGGTERLGQQAPDDARTFGGTDDDEPWARIPLLADPSDVTSKVLAPPVVHQLKIKP
jgi:hypothetical protein